MSSNILRNLPSVNELLDSPPVAALVERLSHNVVVGAVRSVLDDVRTQLKDAAVDGTALNLHELAERVARRALESDRNTLQPVINATGILLHTGLGRAPLAQAASDAMLAVANDYASVELDLVTGKRSHRVRAVERLLCELTGAEAAAVCNNNAGATMLTLAAVAAGREVIVSRGELIEIGGSFRLPDVMATSGAVLREVGTTNKTHLADYRRAIHENTAALMQVHTSNFVVVGFTAHPSLDELIKLGREHELPVIHDIGSGALIDFRQFGFQGEPVAGASIAAGADLVLFSGDKLTGGPQCGIIVGRRQWIERIARHSMMRAVRVDKLTLAALAATLRIYRDPARALAEIPLLKMLSTPLEELEARARKLAGELTTLPAVGTAEAVKDVAYLGGGSIPTQQLDTWCVALEPADETVDRMAAKLRTGTPAVVGRVQRERLYLDLRSVMPRQDAELIKAVAKLSAPEQ